jgi:hypothetical protein
VDVKAFLSIKDFDGINIYGGLLSFIGRSHFLWADLWADYGQNVEEREEQNTKECNENSGRLLADSIFMGGSNYLWADEIIYGQMHYP